MNDMSQTPLEEFGLPEIVEIEPVHSCNLRCIQCHVSYEKLSKNKIRPEFVEKLKGLEGKWALLGSLYEPTVHPQFRDMALALSDAGMKLEMTTNGTLLNDSLVQDIANCNWKNIIFSFDGVKKDTFEKIRRKADFNKTIEAMKRFKDNVKNKDAYFAVNSTLLKSNLGEIEESVEFWENFGADLLGFIAMVLRDENPALKQECLNDDLEKLKSNLELAAKRVIENDYKITLSSAMYNVWMDLKDVYPAHFMDSLVKSNHPDAKIPFNARTYYQNGHFPGMSVGCRSPFKFARIDYNGSVELCYQFTVGSIYEKDFLDIWYGEEAQKVRNLVLSDPKVCHSCDYFKFCIKAGEVDYDQKENFRNEAIDNQFNKPFLVEDKGSYQVVGYGEKFYGFPKSMGDVDPRFIKEYENRKDVFVCSSIESVKQRIDDYFSTIDKSEWVPIELEEWTAHKIVSYGPQLIAVPKGYGKVALNSEFDFTVPGIIIAEDMETLKNKVENYLSTANLSELTPTIVEQTSDYNIVEWSKNIYGIPFSAGKVDVVELTHEQIMEIPAVQSGSSLEEVKEKIVKLEPDEKLKEKCFDLGYNLISFNGIFYGIPHSIGAIDLNKSEDREHPEIFSSPNYDEVIHLIESK